VSAANRALSLWMLFRAREWPSKPNSHSAHKTLVSSVMITVPKHTHNPARASRPTKIRITSGYSACAALVSNGEIHVPRCAKRRAAALARVPCSSPQAAFWILMKASPVLSSRRGRTRNSSVGYRRLICWKCTNSLLRPSVKSRTECAKRTLRDLISRGKALRRLSIVKTPKHR
jgi:hypothetical protein